MIAFALIAITLSSCPSNQRPMGNCACGHTTYSNWSVGTMSGSSAYFVCDKTQSDADAESRAAADAEAKQKKIPAKTTSTPTKSSHSIPQKKTTKSTTKAGRQP